MPFTSQEINPIYECAVTKEEAELPVPDEYEIDYAALTFTEAIGEGAFGKVLKAELDLSLAPIGGRSTGKKIVAVKVLKGKPAWAFAERQREREREKNTN